uniref:Intelectin-2-like n=1 Tax=Phallusia mammillata TaxID=59560 RepID=A0A6F9DG56_9ASCI|nr:intelectin-2-like [Phallusia mammillata]
MCSGETKMFKLLKCCILLSASFSISCGMQSCEEMKGKTFRSGVYNLNTTDGVEYQTYCDMLTNGGGWTLVASIHENNVHDNGRCTVGDKRSSEQGNNQNTNNGDGNWENLKTFGNVASATSNDFKCLVYFSIDDAKDIMIWQVPNNTPLSMWRSNSYLRYRTYGQFLNKLGGNLQNLF